MPSVIIEDSGLLIYGESDEELYNGPRPQPGVFLYRDMAILPLRWESTAFGGAGGYVRTITNEEISFADPDIAFDVASDRKSVELIYTPTDWSGISTPTTTPGGVAMLLTGAGRVYCYPDFRWVTAADDNYGPNYYQFTESGGAGVDPIVEWEHAGWLIPAGRKIKRLLFMGTSNNNEITDLQVRLLAKYPNPSTRWATGIDNDAEVDHIVIHDDLLMAPAVGPAYTGNTNDRRLRDISLDHTLAQLSDLALYFKPVGTNTANRYYRVTWTIEIE